MGIFFEKSPKNRDFHPKNRVFFSVVIKRSTPKMVVFSHFDMILDVMDVIWTSCLDNHVQDLSLPNAIKLSLDLMDIFFYTYI